MTWSIEEAPYATWVPGEPFAVVDSEDNAVFIGTHYECESWIKAKSN